MKIVTLALVTLFGLGQIIGPASAQTSTQTHKTQMHKKTQTHPKNAISKLEKARKTNHAVRQTTPNPKLSPGKHADNLSKNVNHEINRESKDINHAFQNNKKKKQP